MQPNDLVASILELLMLLAATMYVRRPALRPDLAFLHRGSHGFLLLPSLNDRHKQLLLFLLISYPDVPIVLTATIGLNTFSQQHWTKYSGLLLGELVV